MPRQGGAHRPALILLFAKKFFRAPHTRARMRWTGQIFWLLAFEDVESLSLRDESQSQACLPYSTLNTQVSTGLHLPPAFTPKTFSGIGPMGSRIQLQQRNCSRFSRDFLRRSTFPNSQRTGTRTNGLSSERQDYLINCASCYHVER